MILLLGGTTEALQIANALAGEGREFLLSMATAIPLRGRQHPDIILRTGVLNSQELTELISIRQVNLVVDATHPYATEISANAWSACRQAGIRYLAYDRPGSLVDSPNVHLAADHHEAASLACSFKSPLLLTIGVRNLAPYVKAVRTHGIKIVARVLDQPSSLEACREAGLNPEEIVCANGPFTREENISLITDHEVGVLVTKDSGEAGGFQDKISAAQETECQVIVVKRPLKPVAGYPTINALLKAISQYLNTNQI